MLLRTVLGKSLRSGSTSGRSATRALSSLCGSSSPRRFLSTAAALPSEKLSLMLGHTARTLQADKAQLVLETACPGVLSARGLDDPVPERPRSLTAEAATAMLSTMARSRRWNNAENFGRILAAWDAEAFPTPSSSSSSEKLLTREGYAALLAAARARGGKKGFEMAEYWLEAMRRDHALEVDPVLEEWDAYGMPISHGFDWLISRYGHRGDAESAFDVAQTMRYFGIPPTPATVWNLASLGSLAGGAPSDGFLAATRAELGLPPSEGEASTSPSSADPAPSSENGADSSGSGSSSGAKKRIALVDPRDIPVDEWDLYFNRGVSDTGAIGVSPDAIPERFEVSLPRVNGRAGARASPEFVAGIRDLHAAIAEKIKGKWFAAGPSNK